MPNAYISGTGFYVPPRVVTNDDLARIMDTSDEWIRERTGIKERRFAEPGIGPSDLAVHASKAAFIEAGVAPENVDFIIFATSTPDYYAPGSGCLLQHKLGLKNIGALDVRVQCAGFIYGLSVAHQYIRSAMFRNILLVGAEVQSSGLDFSNSGRDTAVIFADGAGAVIVSATEEHRGILSSHLHSDGKYAEELCCRSPASTDHPRLSPKILESQQQYLHMNGNEVFKHAVNIFPEITLKSLSANGLTINDLDLFIPHQANLRITQLVQKRLGLSDSKVVSNIERYGNTTAASIPIALAEAHRDGRIKDGSLLVLAAFGSGFAWGSVAIRW